MRSLLVCVAIAGLTLVAYWGVWHYPFISLDDPLYVYDNPNVKTGFTWDNFVWSWGIHGEGQWHPLAWWSHQLDCRLFGSAQENAGGHHLTNLLLHILASLALLAALQRLTAEFWPSSLVAALFALHPLGVESVAWVSERRDVLSMLCFGLTLWSYAAYAEQPGVLRYLLTVALFVLGLMSKPMLVTLPCVLFLLDFWPLRRTQPASAALAGRCPPWSVAWLIAEKIPLLMLAAVSAWLSYLCQQESGAVGSLASYPLASRLANALLGYVLYLRNMLWPLRLSPIYPLPQSFVFWQVAGAAVTLLAITGIAVGYARRRPYLLVGWLWFLGTLVPVIGLLRMGMAVSMADRYAYLPMIGIYIAIAWTMRDLACRWLPARIALPLATGVWLLLLALATHRQMTLWRNSQVLFERALAVNYDSPYAHYSLANAHLEQRQFDEAIRHYNEALQRIPDFAEAHANLGVALQGREQFDDAIEHYKRALHLKPHLFEIESNLGVALEATGQLDDAIEHYRAALHEEPKHFPALLRLGLALEQQGHLKEAVEQVRAALAIQPHDAAAQSNLRRLEALAKQQAPTGS